MKRTHKIASAVAASLLLAACGTLDQAALIYSSRIVAGVDLSGSATESQGLSLNIGFKTVDFAYVPVAVAASAPQPGVLPLVASSSEDLADAAKRLPADGEARVKAYTEARDKVRRKQQSVADLSANLTAAAAADKPLKEAKLLKAQEELAQLQIAMSAAESAAAADIGKLQQAMRDAMSVYGRFDGRGFGDVGKDKVNGSLTVGRIFSTGVAAQKLTRAAVIEAHSSCLQRYFAVLESIKDETKRGQAAAEVNKACRPPED